jgi:hypothetical protein
MSETVDPEQQLTFETLLWVALRNRPRVDPGNPRSPYVEALDEVARRIRTIAGTRCPSHDSVLHDWASGWRRTIPRARTIRAISGALEVVFGIPEALWLDSWELSRHLKQVGKLSPRLAEEIRADDDGSYKYMMLVVEKYGLARESVRDILAGKVYNLDGLVFSRPRKQCPGINADGEQCRRFIGRDETACSFHRGDVARGYEPMFAPCGTDSAYNRHLRRGEEPDVACREAHRKKAESERRKKGIKPAKVAQCGTVSGYGRHRRDGEEACTACKQAEAEAALTRRRRKYGAPPPVLLQPCGTRAAYKRHVKKGELPCEMCREANARYTAARRRNQAA